jgi:hypothetical protein
MRHPPPVMIDALIPKRNITGLMQAPVNPEEGCWVAGDRFDCIHRKSMARRARLSIIGCG